MSVKIEPNKITAIQVSNVPLLGSYYEIAWDGEVLTIAGVRSWEQLQQLLNGKMPATQSGNSASAAVSQEQPEKAPPGPAPTVPETPSQTAPAEPQEAAKPAPGGPPPPRRPLPFTKLHAVPAAAPQNEEQLAASERDQADAPHPRSSPEGEDLTVFGRLHKFEDIFDEVVRRGPQASYAEIKAKFQQLIDTELCPALDRLTKDGKLDDRIKRRMAAKGMQGALDA